MDNSKNDKTRSLENIEKYITQPLNYGRMNDPDGAAIVKGQCGDEMEMYLIIEAGSISKVLFHSNGCGITLACGSVVTELAEGCKIDESLKIAPLDVINRLRRILGGNYHCAVLAVITLYKALGDYLIKRGK